MNRGYGFKPLSGTLEVAKVSLEEEKQSLEEWGGTLVTWASDINHSRKKGGDG